MLDCCYRTEQSLNKEVKEKKVKEEVKEEVKETIFVNSVSLSCTTADIGHSISNTTNIITNLHDNYVCKTFNQHTGSSVNYFWMANNLVCAALKMYTNGFEDKLQSVKN